MEQGLENQDYSVGLDIGTTKVVAVVGRKNKDGNIEVMGIGRSKSLGVNKGIVSNIAQTINSIKEAITAAEKSAKVSIKKVTVGIAGKHIRSLQKTDSIMRDNPEDIITEKDIDDLKDKINRLVMLPGEEVIQVLPQEYEVDSEGGIKDPVGMYGTRLGAKFHVVVGQMVAIKNIARCIKEAGLEMEALTLEPLASAEAVLKDEEKEAGVAIVDMGGGTTDIAIFKDDIIRHTCVIPYGGEIVTEDIKEGCSIIEKHAEQLKVKYGSALPDLEKDNTFVTIPGLHGRADKEISLKQLAKIIKARVEDILELVDGELKHYGAAEQKKKLIAGIVLTGGGSNLKNIRQLTQYITGFDTKIGYANEYVVNDKNQYLKSPEYATGIGLLMESFKVKEKSPKEEKVEEIVEKPQQEEEENKEEEELIVKPEEVKKKKWWEVLKEKIDEMLKDEEER